MTSFHLLSFKILLLTGDVEFKQNKQLPVEKQIVTANPDVTSVCDFSFWL